MIPGRHEDGSAAELHQACAGNVVVVPAEVYEHRMALLLSAGQQTPSPPVGPAR